jgi:glycerophosphoryl diester phosphodiesterase
MHRLTVQSFWPDDVATLISRLPGVRSSLLVAPGVAEVGVETALAISADAVGLAWPVDTEVIRAARERGLFVMTYTVNDAKAIRAAAQAGVDAIITDDPTVARLCLATPPVLAAARARHSPLHRGRQVGWHHAANPRVSPLDSAAARS